MVHFPFILTLFSTISTLPYLTLADCPSSMKETILNDHNYYRGVHGVPPLSLDSKISSFAVQWSEHLASTHTFSHRQNNPYGENLFQANGVTNYQMALSSTKAFYDEIKYYDFNTDNGNFHKWGHFTQLIWKDSRRIGVGCALSAGSLIVTVNYAPPGNANDIVGPEVVPPIA